MSTFLRLMCSAKRLFRSPGYTAAYGEKLNAGIALAQGSLIAIWNDDDIMLPWHLSKSIEQLADSGYYNPQVYWFLDPQGLHKDHVMGVGHMCSIFTRSAFNLVHGYSHTTGEEDQILDHRLKTHPQVKTARPPLSGVHDWSYIYRWGVSPVHLSGRQPIEEWYARIGQLPVERGQYFLRPHWREDYLRKTQDAMGISPFIEVSL